MCIHALIYRYRYMKVARPAGVGVAVYRGAVLCMGVYGCVWVCMSVYERGVVYMNVRCRTSTHLIRVCLNCLARGVK